MHELQRVAPSDVRNHVKTERVTMNCTTKTALHNHARKFLLTCMANVFTYDTPSRQQYHEELVPTPPVYQLFTSTSNVAFCFTDTDGYRTPANLLRRLAVATKTNEFVCANAKKLDKCAEEWCSLFQDAGVCKLKTITI